ncbi:MAG: metal ABC transporter solute-binding protein, Zn/Mn family [Casimicrobiaceae bacterium]
MRSRGIAVVAAVWLGLISPVASALQVFACEPEWAALVRMLAPEAQVRVATHAGQDPHEIDARPSLIAALRQADVAVCTGAGLEAGWLPMLQSRAGNPRVQPGQPGMIEMARFTTLIDPRPATLSPFAGDVHPEGNPHFHLDPARWPALARGLAEALGRVVPAQATAYRQRAEGFAERWQRRVAEWKSRLTGASRMRLAVQHTTFAYLFDFAGVRVVADLEPKPGVPPTSGHLSATLAALRGEPPHAVWIAAYQDPRPARWLAAQLPGLRWVQHPATVVETAAEAELVAWFDALVEALVALERSGPPR